MKRYLWIFAVLPFLWSCIAEDSSACPQPRGVSVRMSVCPDPMTAVPRAADEEALRDLNFYLLDADGNVVQHRYQSSPTLRFECLPGNYLLRIAANMGRDLGENPASEDFTVTHADEYDMLPMSYEGEVSVPSSDETVTLPTVEVQRVVAKITYNISVAPDAGDIRLHSVQPVNLPARVPVFDPGLRAAEYTAGEIVGSSSQTLTGTFYMLPNLQGEVPSIADQRDKGPANAPADATFLRIRALRGSKVLDYYIYPGGNNTSNFDIRANTHYRLDIMIRGDAEVDTRIRAYTVEVLCTPEAALSNGFLLERQPDAAARRGLRRDRGRSLRGAEDRRCAVFRVRGPMGRRCKDDGDPGPGERLRYPLLAAVLHARGVPLYVPGSDPRPLRGGRLVQFPVLLRPPASGLHQMVRRQQRERHRRLARCAACGRRHDARFVVLAHILS